MAKRFCTGQITITDLNDGKIVSTYTSASLGFSQMLDSDTKKYDKDYSTNPNVLTPHLYLSGESGDQASKLTGIKWKVNGTEVTSTTTGFKASGQTLSISKNLSDNVTAYNIEWTATYTDTTLKQSVTVGDTTQISYVKSGNTSPKVYLQFPDSGYTFNGDITSITVRAFLKRGENIDKDNLDVKWYQLGVVNNAASWGNPISTGGVDSNTGYATFTRTRDQVDGQASYKVTFHDTKLNDGTFEEYFSLMDKLDEWRCEVNGTKVIKPGMSSVTIEATVYKNNQPLSDFTGLTFNWYKKDRSGGGVNWDGTTSNVKTVTGGKGTGNTLTVMAKDINTQTDILCEVVG